MSDVVLSGELEFLPFTASHERTLQPNMPSKHPSLVQWRLLKWPPFCNHFPRAEVCLLRQEGDLLILEGDDKWVAISKVCI